MEDFIAEIVVIVFVFLLIGSVFSGVIYIRNKMDTVPVIVKYQNKVIFTGPSCAIRISSSGNTTTVEVRNGFLYLFPQKIYSGQGIEVVGEK